MRPEMCAGAFADVPVLAGLHAQCFATGWDAQFLGRLLAQPGALFLLARDETGPVGFAIVRVAADEAEILSLGVVPALRRAGIGAALARACAERAGREGAAALFLEVSVDNRAARALYGKLGFREVGRRPAYYCGPPGTAGDALVLRCDLPL